MARNDNKQLEGFNDILAGINCAIDDGEDTDTVASNKKTLDKHKLFDSVFGGNDNIDDIKKISDNNQLLVKNKQKNYHAGHRQRARDRFMRAPSASTDVELLELLLFTIIPRADTRETAYELINHFKNLRNVSNATAREISSCGVNGENLKYVFKLCSEIVARMLENDVEQRQPMDGISKLLTYCKVKIGTLLEEEFHVLFLDNKMRLIKDEKFGIESVNDIILHTREIIQRTLDLHASNVVLAHNHPSGDVAPSQIDMETTAEIKKTLKSIGIKLIDHIIVSGNMCYCFSQNYLLGDD